MSTMWCLGPTTSAAACPHGFNQGHYFAEATGLDLVDATDRIAELEKALAEANARAEAVDVNAIRRVIATLAKRLHRCSCGAVAEWVEGHPDGPEYYCDKHLRRPTYAWTDPCEENDEITTILADPAIRPYLEQADHAPS